MSDEIIQDEGDTAGEPVATPAPSQKNTAAPREENAGAQNSGTQKHQHTSEHKAPAHHAHKPVHESQESHHQKHHIIIGLYEKHYKALMLFSMLLLIFSLVVIGYQYATTGEIVHKGASLTGGITLTAQLSHTVDPDAVGRYFAKAYPTADITVRSFGSSTTGSFGGIIVDASGVSEPELTATLKEQFPELTAADISVRAVGPSLGTSFFTQTLKAVFIAFLFMSLVVFLYFGEGIKLKWIATGVSILAGIIMFYGHALITIILALILWVGLMVMYLRTSVPSFAIILCAISDIFFSLAIFNLSGMKLNIAGVAAFLMLVGYSIDTDILMSVRVLKRREGAVFDRMIGAMKTGLMMSFSALIAVLSAYFFTSSDVIKEIMFILAVGLVGDIVFTWIQNAGILRWHLERKGWK